VWELLSIFYLTFRHRLDLALENILSEAAYGVEARHDLRLDQIRMSGKNSASQSELPHLKNPTTDLDSSEKNASIGFAARLGARGTERDDSR